MMDTQMGISGGSFVGHVGAAKQYASNEIAETSALTKAGITLANTQDLCRRIQQLADRLVGSVPTPVQNARGTEPPQTVFPALRQMADETGAAVLMANEALDRIERALP